MLGQSWRRAAGSGVLDAERNVACVCAGGGGCAVVRMGCGEKARRW